MAKPWAVVTGANGVFGRHICMGLAESGRFSRVICVVRSQKRWTEATKSLTGRIDKANQAGTVMQPALCDLSDPESISGLAKQLGDAPVGCLVNNAAFTSQTRQESAKTGEEMQWSVCCTLHCTSIMRARLEMSST
eukprot:m.95051 g.95051  ORF g.95051 m.95051 type:complete len:136 (+) comp10085_c0_seq2:67-474(+)